MYYISFDNDTKHDFRLEDWNYLPFYNIKTIFFNFSGLTSLPNLDKLINLQELDCNNNQLKELPITIRKCYKLNYYKKKYDIFDYQYIENLPYEVNENIEKYYYKPILNYYNSKYL
jgi:Leucine-rich repeat (LRR) protein